MTNTETMRPMVWAVVVWKLPHGTFVALRTADDTIAPVGCQLTTGQTPQQAATRVTQQQVGLDLGDWVELPARDGIHLMVSTVNEAPVDLAGDTHWMDVEQLPLLSAISGNHDLFALWHALQGI